MNTLAFFVCFQNRIIRDEQKLQQEEMVRQQNRRKFYQDFEQNMIEKQKFKLEGLTDDEMKNHDDVKSLYIAQNLINTIENESRDFTYNFIVSQIQTNGGADLSNRSLVQQINRRIKQRVSGEAVQLNVIWGSLPLRYSGKAAVRWSHPGPADAEISIQPFARR